MSPDPVLVRIALIVTLPIVPAAIGAWQAPMAAPLAGSSAAAVADTDLIDRAALRQGMATGRLVPIDARESAGSDGIPGSLPLAALIDADGRRDPFAGIRLAGRIPVVYCASRRCDAAARAASRLRAVGITDVRVYRDGWEGWTAP